MCNDDQFDIDHLTWLETQAIPAYRAAVLALSSGAQQYQLNTGQTTQMVQRASLTALKTTLSSLMNERATTRARLYGGSIHVRPAF